MFRHLSRIRRAVDLLFQVIWPSSWGGKFMLLLISLRSMAIEVVAHMGPKTCAMSDESLKASAALAVFAGYDLVEVLFWTFINETTINSSIIRQAT